MPAKNTVVEVYAIQYRGDHDPNQERECIRTLRAKAKGKRLVDLKDPNVVGVECWFKGKIRFLRILGSEGEWLNRIDLGFKKKTE